MYKSVSANSSEKNMHNLLHSNTFHKTTKMTRTIMSTLIKHLSTVKVKSKVNPSFAISNIYGFFFIHSQYVKITFVE